MYKGKGIDLSLFSQRLRRTLDESRQQRLDNVLPKIPALPNQIPFNDMVMDGILKLGEFGVKTRSTPYWEKHINKQVLFYNSSSRIAWPSIEAHGYDLSRLTRRALIGVGRLVKVRELTAREKKILFRQFNNWTRERQRTHRNDLRSKDPGTRYRAFTHDFIRPFPFGLFFEDVRRFKEPVPFAWPSGPVQERLVPLSLVAKALKQVGIDPKKIVA